jgi:hypothetical protein
MYDNEGRSAWDYQWLYTHLKNSALTIIPRVNLVANIGFGPGATHTAEVDSRFTPPAKAIQFPLLHPSWVVPLRSVDRRIQELCSTSLPRRISGKMRRVVKRFFAGGGG